MAESGYNPAIEARKDRKDSSPEVRREIEVLLTEFQEGVFLPVLSEFAASVGATSARAGDNQEAVNRAPTVEPQFAAAPPSRQVVYCEACGTAIGPTAAFCRQCGAAQRV
jgi:hypothetical protein